MSMQSLFTAATGMDAMQTNLDVIANNLANVNTVSFKTDRVMFEDLFYINEILPGLQDPNGGITATGVHIGLGSRVNSTQADFRQGPFIQTDKQLDLAIEGRGFFMVNDPITQQIVYTRAGNFAIDANGQIVLGSAQMGRVLEPTIQVPNDAVGIVVGADGQVFVQQAGNQNLVQLGQIQLATFVDPEGLLKLGENLYAETTASGPANITNPGIDGTGVLRQNALEGSNVEPVRQLVDLITTQRAFELNSQVVQASDQMLQLVANLRRF